MRVVDIDRVGASTALVADEAWVVDPAARTPRGTAPAASPVGRPQLVVRPGPLSDLEADVARNRSVGGPRVVRLCPGPGQHDYPLEPWVLSPLPEFCDRESIAFLIDPGPSPVAYPWGPIVKLARAHPGLVVVALSPPLGGWVARRALDAAPNLVLSASARSDADIDDLRRLVDAVGAYRLAYGSGDAAAPPLALSASMPAGAAEEMLAGTADLIDRGAWGPTYL